MDCPGMEPGSPAFLVWYSNHRAIHGPSSPNYMYHHMLLKWTLVCLFVVVSLFVDFCLLVCLGWLFYLFILLSLLLLLFCYSFIMKT